MEGGREGGRKRGGRDKGEDTGKSFKLLQTHRKLKTKLKIADKETVQFHVSMNTTTLIQHLAFTFGW